VPYLILSLLFLAVLTPVGEELLFRGVVATALMRYGPVVGVAGSAVIFSAVHGLNAAAVTARLRWYLYLDGTIELEAKATGPAEPLSPHLVIGTVGAGQSSVDVGPVHRTGDPRSDVAYSSL
jgi:membrane protease YdiL (CAAX protease family)